MIRLISGLDIGNGYVKGSVRNADNPGSVASIDIPSGVAYVTSTHDIKTSLSGVDDLMVDFYNKMDVSFDSPLIPDTNRRLFGTRGLQSGMSIDEFDVYSHTSKAKQPLSAILTLGCIAGKAMQEYWSANRALPTERLQVSTVIALALPILEYKKFREPYADGYKSSKHVVTIHNFEQPVEVEISFSEVRVIAEGAAAHHAIRARGEKMMNAMLADVRNMSANDPVSYDFLSKLTAADILGATNTVGIDIGEGTVNFPVFQAKEFNPDASITFDKGYGMVLNTALDRLRDQGHAFNSRKELQNFLNTTPTTINQRRYAIVQKVVDEEITSFVKEVTLQFSKILSRVGSYVEVIYVYGGGASPVRNELYSALVDCVKSYGGGEVLYPILYLDSRYSRYLNREGLCILAESVASGSAE